MLGGAREANHAAYKRVVTTVSAPGTTGQQLIQTVAGLRAPTHGHLKAQCT
jgi:hypothetical protein